MFQVAGLAQDQRHNIVLQTGIALEVSAVGVFLSDLTGFIQISLWNRNSHSNIMSKYVLYNEAVVKLTLCIVKLICFGRLSVLQRTVTRIESSFIKTNIEITSHADASLDFTTDLEFSSTPFKMCTQMNQAPLIARLVLLVFALQKCSSIIFQLTFFILQASS